MSGCWLGKAIGGTLGATYEAQRGAFDIDYCPTDVSNGMIPNDDLDLQLVWLNALERCTSFVNQPHCGTGYSEHSVLLCVDEAPEVLTTVYCAISFRGFSSRLTIPVTFGRGR